MRAERILVIAAVLMGLTSIAFSVVMSASQVNQLGGTGLVSVTKADVRVLSVKIGSAASSVTSIDQVTVTVSSSVPGSYRVEALVSVGACSAYGSTTASLGTTGNTLTIYLSPVCPYSSTATVTIRVTQP
ncbi:MAG: hypothetical protein QXW56_09250 [Nitrososphaerota archaeon]